MASVLGYRPTLKVMELIPFRHILPSRIRATYTTPAHDFRLSDQFLSSTKPPVTGSQSLLPIFHVTSEDFVPSLLPGELERIDNTCEQDRFCVEKRLAPDAFAAARTAVLGKKEDRPDVSEAFKKRNPRECANCHKVSKDKNFKMCSQSVCSSIWLSQNLALTNVVQMQACLLLRCSMVCPDIV
jgi:hypothetical protein